MTPQFSSNRVADFVIRLCITLIVAAPVIIWTWDTVKETSGSDIIAASFYILVFCALWVFSYFFFSSLSEVLSPDNENSRKENEENK